MKRFFSIRSMILSILLLGALMLVMMFGTRTVTSSATRESKRIAEEAIHRALITCYAAEGTYPASYEYLEKHYGLHIDEEKYYVRYSMFAENVLPNVELIEKKAGQEETKE